MWEREEALLRKVKMEQFERDQVVAEAAAAQLRASQRNLVSRSHRNPEAPEGVSDLGQELA